MPTWWPPRGRNPWLPVSLAVAAVVALVVWLVPFGDPDLDGLGAPSDTTTPSPHTSTPPRAGTSSTPAASTSAPTTAAPAGVTLAFAGDVHFTGRTEGLLDDPPTAFGPIADTLAAADVAMVNLETAITERGTEEPKEFHFRAPPTALAALAAAGVDVASLANNHAVDYGPEGLDDTLAAVATGPVAVVGIGADAASAYAPHRMVIRGTALAFFGASQVPDRTFQAWSATDTSPGIASTADTGRLVAGVRAASAAGDVVVVYLHWGIEGDPCPTTDMQQLAAELAAAGADAIVGTHAHLMLGAGYLDAAAGTSYVAYGLGNFLWWRSRAASDDTGVLTLTVRDGGVVDAAFTPALIDPNGRPQPVLGPAAAEKASAFDALRGCTDLRG